MRNRAEMDGFHWFLIFVIILLLGVFAITGMSIYAPIDSDGDGLSDIDENITGTDVDNPNTDGDRYLDGEDGDPLNVNSARIEYHMINEEEDYHVITIAKDAFILGAHSFELAKCGSIAIGACVKGSASLLNSLEDVLKDKIYTSSGEVVFSNVGDDYTDYLNFNLVYRMGDQVLYEVPYTTDRIYPNKIVKTSFSYDIKVEDVRYIFWDMILNKDKIKVTVERVDYESFS